MKRAELDNYMQIEKSFELFLTEKQNDLIKRTAIHILTFIEEPFYEWSSDDNEFDYSGEISKTNFFNKDKVKTVAELLDCYTGDKVPSYQSGRGWNYPSVYCTLHELFTDIIFGEYLSEYITIHKDYLSTFNFELEENESIEEYLNFNDVVGDANIDISGNVIDYINKIDLELLIEISTN